MNTQTGCHNRFRTAFVLMPLLSLLSLSLTCLADQAVNDAEMTDPTPERAAVSLSELAASADVVAVVQMRDGDYRYQRGFPVSGSAYLQMLIPYKVDQALDLVEVYETGLHEHECYFPNPTVFEEGRRYLVFLRRDPDDAERYRGLKEGCALDVLVTADSAYALRIPATGIVLSDPLLDFAKALVFADPYSRETDETLDSVKRDVWLEKGWLRRVTGEDGEELQYTLGVSLEDVRSLMGPDGVSLDWHVKRVLPEP